MPLKICLLTDHHICVNPRLWKEAFFYESKGFEVTIINKWQSKDLLEKDLEILEGHAITYKFYLNLIPGQVPAVKRFYYRLRKRAAGDFQKYCRIGTAWAISHAPGLMYSKALKEQADLYAAHLECAFFVGKKLVEAGKKVSFDFEDWYSHDYLVAERPVKLLARLEQFGLDNGIFCTTTSEVMARALKEYYESSNDLQVVYNGFSLRESLESNVHKIQSNESIKILWFSRTVGAGRGIEFFLDALESYNRPVELHLLGNTDDAYKDYLDKRFSRTRHHLKLHAFIPHRSLVGFISQFDIGLAIEENINDNKDLTVSNKILQYLQAGIPVLASDTKGHREVAEFFPSSVLVTDINKPGEIIKALEFIRTNVINKTGQQQIFEKFFSWEAQEKKLTALLQKKL